MLTITTLAGANGSITPNNPTAVHGSNVALSITPNVGYHIDSVFVDGWHVGTVADYQFNNLTSSHTVSAKFAVNYYTITISYGSNGNIQPGSITLIHGSNYPVGINPNTGYHVDSVFLDGIHIGAVTSYQFNNLSANHTLYAKFAINIFTITATTGANGTISPGTSTLNYGSSDTSNEPNTVYHVDSVCNESYYSK